jgi:hypothetical protein
MNTIYDCLRTDHLAVKLHFDRLASASTGEAMRSEVLKVLRALVPHSRAEEAVFYSALRELLPMSERLQISYGEHLRLEVELHELESRAPESGPIGRELRLLADGIRGELVEHVAMEEREIFTIARDLFAQDEAIAIGNAFEQLKPLLLSQNLDRSETERIAALLPARTREAFLRRFVPEGLARAA